MDKQRTRMAFNHQVYAFMRHQIMRHQLQTQTNTKVINCVYFLLAIVNDDTCHGELRNAQNFILWHVFLTIMAEPAWHLWHGWIITSKSSMLSIVLQKIVSMPRYQIPAWISDYRKLSDIRLIKPPTLKVSRLGLHLSLRHTLKPNVKWRMKM